MITNLLLNIESFGCKTHNYRGDAEISKFYMTSLTYKTNWLFGSKKKSFYIPIRFESDEHIKMIMKYFDTLFFYVNSSNTTMYHISEICNIKKILKDSTRDIFDLDFCIYYKDRVIQLTEYIDRYNPYLKTDDFIINDGDSNSLAILSQHFLDIPRLNSFSILDKKNIMNYVPIQYRVSEFSKIIDKIDREEEQDIKDRKEIESKYSKKTFKLVEE